MSRLPDLPSELIRLALLDLAKCEESDAYKINMNIWHAGGMEPCRVCWAGSVMAQTLDMPVEQTFDPEDFSPDTRRKLRALNEFRVGRVDSGLVSMGFEPPLAVDEDVPPYNPEDSAAFHRQMEAIAHRLEGLGL